MGKLSFLAGMAAGYVLGARAGQERYEQIKTQTNKAWKSDPVQTKVGQASEAAKTKAAPYVTEKIGDAAKAAAQQMKKTTGNEDLPETIHRGTDGRLHADTSGFGPGPDKLP
ncbi:protoporphyrinogen oxidase [Actinomycetota bacterium]